MGTPYLSEMRIVAFNYPPKGWAFCNGQLLPINQNQALFSLLGTTYGGNGVQNFSLPNLKGRVPIHFGNGFTQGQSGGEVNHTLTTNELPAHSHQLNGAAARAAQAAPPTGGVLARASAQTYSPGFGAPTALDPSTVTNTGGTQPHANQQPYLVLNVCIALQGIFPSRN